MERNRRYYFINRPPFIGTHPKGAVALESWQPKQSVPEIPDWTFHGWVEYDFRLPYSMIWEYELYPADETELVLYNEWRDENNK